MDQEPERTGNAKWTFERFRRHVDHEIDALSPKFIVPLNRALDTIDREEARLFLAWLEDTAKDPTCGTARVRVQDLSTETWVRDFQVDLSSRRVEWQYFVSVIELDPNKTYRLEVTSDDDAPIVFDGCAGTVVGRLN